LIKLHSQQLVSLQTSWPLVPGMQVSAEIREGTRTVLEYLLSPVQRTFSEAGTER
jgi:HlyD family secretion protein